MSYYSEIIRLIDYIEDHIDRPLTLEDMSQLSNYSKFHLHRFFKAITGHTLSDYIRGRKLSKSVALLMHSDYSIEYISAQLAYEHPTNFSRAFKKQFQLTPYMYRKLLPEVTLVPKIQIGELNELSEGIFFNYSVTYMPDFWLLGKKHKIYYEDNIQNLTANAVGKQFVTQYKKLVTQSLEPTIYYGLTTEMSPIHATYMPSFRVAADTVNTNPDLSLVKVSQHMYAVFKYMGAHKAEDITFTTLQQILFFIHDWLNKKHYQMAEMIQFEKIDDSKSKSNYCEAHIYIPIQEMITP